MQKTDLFQRLQSVTTACRTTMFTLVSYCEEPLKGHGFSF
jgi:hypothetical protein